MALTTYTFDTQLRHGKVGEAILDKVFAGYFDISQLSLQEEREGRGDRLFRNPEGEWTVEYKTEPRAQDTGNIFIETVSSDTGQKMGWVYKLKADRIIFLPLGYGRAYIVKPRLLKQAVLDDWPSKYRVRAAKNRGYWSYGLLVPVKVIAELAHAHARTNEGILVGDF